MANIANIVVSDGKGTPLSHTYKPVTAGQKMAWRTADSSLPLVGQESLSMALTVSKTGVNVVSLVLDLPALETATGANSSGYTAAPKVAYSNRVKVEFLLPNRGLPAQRTDLRVLLRNLLADAQIIDIVDNLTPAI